MTYSIILDFWMDIHLWEDFWTSNITIQSGCRPAWLTRTSTDTFHCKLSSLSQILTCIFLHRCNWQPRTSISPGLVWSQNNEYVTQFANRRLTKQNGHMLYPAFPKKNTSLLGQRLSAPFSTLDGSHQLGVFTLPCVVHGHRGLQQSNTRWA